MLNYFHFSCPNTKTNLGCILPFIKLKKNPQNFIYLLIIYSQFSHWKQIKIDAMQRATGDAKRTKQSKYLLVVNSICFWLFLWLSLSSQIHMSKISIQNICHFHLEQIIVFGVLKINEIMRSEITEKQRRHKFMLIIINMINYYKRIKEGKPLHNMLTVLQDWGWTRKYYIVYVLIPCTSHSVELFFNESISEFGKKLIILTFLWEFFGLLFDAM